MIEETRGKPMHETRSRIIAVVAGALLIAACGGGSSDSAPAASDPVDSTAPATDPPSTDPPSSEAPPATVVSEQLDVPDETAPETTTTTEAPAPPPEPLDLDTVPTLVAAVQPDAGAPPLEIAQGVIGFPFEIPVPDSARFYAVSLRVRAADGDAGAVLDHEFGYVAEDVVADIDIDLDDNGPGSVEVIDLYDPILGDLGFERRNSSTSDPGEPGGPNSVNHVYVSEAPTVDVNGVVGTPGRVFVWADENLEGRGEDSTEELLTGRRIEVAVDTDPGDGFASPLLAAIAAAVPVPDEATLAGGDIRSITRQDDSFDIERGRTYIDVSIEWTIDSSFEDVVALFEGPDRLADGDVIGAETSFFEPTQWVVTEGSMFSDGDWRRDVLIAERYDGRLAVEASDEAGGPVTVTLDVDLNPIAPLLSPPE